MIPSKHIWKCSGNITPYLQLCGHYCTWQALHALVYFTQPDTFLTECINSIKICGKSLRVYWDTWMSPHIWDWLIIRIQNRWSLATVMRIWDLKNELKNRAAAMFICWMNLLSFENVYSRLRCFRALWMLSLWTFFTLSEKHLTLKLFFRFSAIQNSVSNQHRRR